MQINMLDRMIDTRLEKSHFEVIRRLLEYKEQKPEYDDWYENINFPTFKLKVSTPNNRVDTNWKYNSYSLAYFKNELVAVEWSILRTLKLTEYIDLTHEGKIVHFYTYVVNIHYDDVPDTVSSRIMIMDKIYYSDDLNWAVVDLNELTKKMINIETMTVLTGYFS
jgi:uncharacterized protein YxeA